MLYANFLAALRPETEQGAPNGTTPRENTIFHSSQLRGRSRGRPMQRQLKTIWRTNFRKLFLGCMQKLSTNVYWTFARKTLTPKHCIHAFHPVPNIFIWVVHGNVFSGSCSPYSWHRNFFNLKTKEKAQGSFSSFCCRVTPHNYANNFLFAPIVDRVSCKKFAFSLISVLRVTYKFRRNRNRVEKKRKRSITFHVHVWMGHKEGTSKRNCLKKW